MEYEFCFTIQGDNEGYITFECPFCGSEFKLNAAEYQDEDNPLEDLFCPYCGLTKNKDSFNSKEVTEKIEALAENYVIEAFNSAFNNMKKSINRSSKVIKMEFKPLKKIAVKELVEKDMVEIVFTCSCDRHVKALSCVGESKIFCPYCGVDI